MFWCDRGANAFSVFNTSLSTASDNNNAIFVAVEKLRLHRKVCISTLFDAHDEQLASILCAAYFVQFVL